MKAVITAGTMEMVIENKELFTRPTITGNLWAMYKSLDLEAWLFIYGQPRFNEYIEIDFALALMNDPLLSVKWIEPIEGYYAGEYNTV
jgi:hypothetical protein